MERYTFLQVSAGWPDDGLPDDEGAWLRGSKKERVILFCSDAARNGLMYFPYWKSEGR